MSITPQPPANFSPEIQDSHFTPPQTGYTKQGAFRFWCQTVLPLVYDDSLSYYELLNKVVHYLNNVISDVASAENNILELYNSFNQLQDNTNNNIELLLNAYNDLQGYVNSYFDGLDVQEEINNKLDELVSDGTLSRIVFQYLGYVTPQMYGAKGIGTDDSEFFQNMFDGECGTVLIPDGEYIVSQLRLKNDTNIICAKNAKIIQKIGEDEYDWMLELNGFSLSIQNGIIDCNNENKSIRPYCITGNVLHEKKLILKNVTFKNISKVGVYLTELGGIVEVNTCEFYDTTWETATQEAGTLFNCQGGEVDHPGTVYIINNKAISYCYMDNGMTSAPGGFFFSCRDDLSNLSHGNGSSVFASGNYFHGFGLTNVGGNIIYPLHFYPMWKGVFISENKFEKSMHGAIAIKSCEDVVISNNVIIDSLVHDKVSPNINYGMISYTPNHHNHTANTRKSAVITNNIIDGCGGTTTQKGIGIVVMGSNEFPDDTYARDVIVSNNVIRDGRKGIAISFSKNIEIASNILNEINTTGISWQTITGTLNIHNNTITCKDTGAGIAYQDGSPNADLTIKDNIINTENGYGIHIRGCKKISIYGNNIKVTGSIAPIFVTRYSEAQGNISFLNLVNNMIESAYLPDFRLQYIDEISGQFNLYGWSSSIVAAIGTTFVDYTTKKMYIQVSTTKDTWKEIQLATVE